jgi:hypothetical protein
MVNLWTPPTVDAKHVSTVSLETVFVVYSVEDETHDVPYSSGPKAFSCGSTTVEGPTSGTCSLKLFVKFIYCHTCRNLNPSSPTYSERYSMAERCSARASSARLRTIFSAMAKTLTSGRYEALTEPSAQTSRADGHPEKLICSYKAAAGPWRSPVHDDR